MRCTCRTTGRYRAIRGPSVRLPPPPIAISAAALRVGRHEHQNRPTRRIALRRIAARARPRCPREALPGVPSSTAAEQAFEFYRNVVANDLCHFVALTDGEVVGWCDVLPTHGESRIHVGTLGIGLIASARRQGTGAALMEATIAKAWAKGLSRIELTVRADNLNARALYERMGFRMEGLHHRAFLVDGEFYDSYSMALLRRDGARPSRPADPQEKP
ncbi:MAG: GNAT family N-acetyltransferase [Candidatus Methylophosphatis roskildensis]